MSPDAQFANDMKISLMLTTVMIFIYLAFANGGYAPVDSCANSIIDTLSPFQVHQLTDSSYPANYVEVANFCIDHLDNWPDLLNEARTFRELPSRPDMHF